MSRLTLSIVLYELSEFLNIWNPHAQRWRSWRPWGTRRKQLWLLGFRRLKEGSQDRQVKCWRSCGLGGHGKNQHDY